MNECGGEGTMGGEMVERSKWGKYGKKRGGNGRKERKEGKKEWTFIIN